MYLALITELYGSWLACAYERGNVNMQAGECVHVNTYQRLLYLSGHSLLLCLQSHQALTQECTLSDGAVLHKIQCDDLVKCRLGSLLILHNYLLALVHTAVRDQASVMTPFTNVQSMIVDVSTLYLQSCDIL